MGIQKRLKTSTRKLVESDNMLSGITVASLLESTIVPIPLEAVLVPLMQARRDKLWLIALMATLGCLVGAIIGYGIGIFSGKWVTGIYFAIKSDIFIGLSWKN